jgi:hypothetical protein
MLLDESPRWCDDVPLLGIIEGSPSVEASCFCESLRRGASPAEDGGGGTARRRDDSVLATSVADSLGGTADSVVDAVEPRWDLSPTCPGLPSTRRGPLSSMSSFRSSARSDPSCRLDA